MNPERQPLLIELGTEELPPRALKQLSQAFTSSLAEALLEAGMLEPDAEIRAYATPRRLAARFEGVASTQRDHTQLRKGPAVKAAFDENGEPTRAALGFARSCGVEVSELGRDQTPQGEWLVYEQTVAGKSIGECAQEALDTAILQLPIPKRMRWGDRNAEFVRPVHWLLALYGDSTLPLRALELVASNRSRGHRFHHPGEIEIANADTYEDALGKAYVIADFDARQQLIREQCEELARANGGNAVLDEDLLDEVTGLVEWPVSIIGNFRPDFLGVPREALVASMKDHQKYFHLTGADGHLLPRFITVSNIESSAPERVLTGNERVLQARLSDAQFFWEQDRQHPLTSNAERLESLLFHVKLGSMADKTRRLVRTSGRIAAQIGANISATEHAATLCKLDLVSQMVGEFASLQGTMGRYYAQNDGESAVVADAIEQHYWPKFAGDRLPQSMEATALALADRLDALVGIFATGEKPTGVKDPYALRRAMLGILRMLIEHRLEIDLPDLLDLAIAAYGESDDVAVSPNADTRKEIEQFALDRLRAWYTGQGFDIHAFNAVAEVAPARASDFDRRLRAISDFFQRETSAATSLAAANKRIANILRKSGLAKIGDYDPSLLRENAEQVLGEKLERLRRSTAEAFASQAYAEGLTQLASLESPVNTFFDEVRVMDEDTRIRDNRLALLAALRGLFLQVADISHLIVES